MESPLVQSQHVFLLLVRLYWGWQFMQTGYGKLQHLDRVASFFASLQIPLPHANALLVAIVECVGGLLFMLGLGARWMGLALFINMSVAFLAADREALSMILSDPEKFYNADPFTFWFAALLILLFGPGRWAVDSLLKRRWFHAR